MGFKLKKITAGLLAVIFALTGIPIQGLASSVSDHGNAGSGTGSGRF